MSLRRRLAVLVAFALLPPLLLTIYNTARWQVVVDENARVLALADSKLVASELEQVIDNARLVLEFLGKHPAVPANEAECTQYFKTAVDEFPVYSAAAMIDADGHFHCASEPVADNTDVRDQAFFRTPAETGRLAVTAFASDPLTHASTIGISLPFQTRPDAPAGVLLLVLNADELGRVIAVPPAHWPRRVMVLDSSGQLIFALPHLQRRDSAALAHKSLAQLSAEDAHTLDTGQGGADGQIVGYTRTSAQYGNFAVLVAFERADALKEARDIAAPGLILGIMTALIAIGGVWIATHILIVRPIGALMDAARRREAGDRNIQFPLFDSDTELAHLSAVLRRMAAKLDQMIDQKTLLLRELQHRVMNSLNLLASVLDMQGRGRDTLPEVRHQLAQARNRIVAIGQIYRYLYETDNPDDVDVAALLRDVCAQAEKAYAGEVHLAIDVEAVPLVVSGRDGIALAMLTHELITNTIKHAYGEGESGHARLVLEAASNGGYDFRYADFGRGLPADFDLAQSSSLGMKMVASTARQFGGELQIRRLDPGTEFVLHLSPDIGSREGGPPKAPKEPHEDVPPAEAAK
jgi:two-component sensor histidine kinase